jgi:hypothetical protein
MGSLLLLFGFLYRNDLPALVETTIRADDVLRNHGTAIRTSNQVDSFQGIMGAPAIAATFREFTLWLWGHSFSFFCINTSMLMTLNFWFTPIITIEMPHIFG